MRRKIIALLVCGVCMAVVFPMNTQSGDPENPEIEDNIRDVFGLFGFLPQICFRHIDMQSAWFFEDVSDPDYLYVSLKLRALESETEMLEAIYVVLWSCKGNAYAACVHITPEGLGTFLSGKTDEFGNDFEKYAVCDGILDEENGIITWAVPKHIIGHPHSGDILTNTAAVTTLRCTEESGLPRMDLLKDLALKNNRDYTIQY